MLASPFPGDNRRISGGAKVTGVPQPDLLFPRNSANGQAGAVQSDSVVSLEIPHVVDPRPAVADTSLDPDQYRVGRNG